MAEGAEGGRARAKEGANLIDLRDLGNPHRHTQPFLRLTAGAPPRRPRSHFHTAIEILPTA